MANMLMHKLAYETTNKQEMRRKFREALLAESAACRADAQAVVQRDPAAAGVLARCSQTVPIKATVCGMDHTLGSLDGQWRRLEFWREAGGKTVSIEGVQEMDGWTQQVDDPDELL